MTNPLGKSALKVLLGLVFVVSAVLKLFDMDKFEIYIYSYHFFSLNASFMVARLAIILELVLGIGLISHCLHKLMWWGSIAMLAGYSLLLIYAMYLGRTDSCHCFGDFLQLDPKQSLVKNGVLMLLFLPIYRMESWKAPFRWLILCLTVMVSTIAVFVISPPDNLTSNADCFFSTSCEVCQLAAHKLSLMQQFYDFPKENITYLFMGNEEGIAKFYEKSGSAQYRDVLYPDLARMLKAVNGNFPVVVLLEDGEVVHEYGFRNMNESEIQAFMVI